MAILVIGLATVVFVDLTWGMFPITTPLPKLTSGEIYVKNQSGDFRILEYPITWAYSNYEATLINHEIVGVSPIAIRAYPPNNELFTLLADSFNALPSEPTGFAENLTLLSTLCGVKYVVIDKNQCDSANYTAFYNNATSLYSLVFQDQNCSVYQNLYFKGTAFAVKDNGTIPTFQNLTLQDFSNSILNDSQVSLTEGFNRMEIFVNTTQPAYVVVSEAYSPYWSLAGTNTQAFTEFLNVSEFQAKPGIEKVNLNFSVADQTTNLYMGILVPLSLCCMLFYAEAKGKKKIFKLGLILLVFFGLTLILLTAETRMISSFLKNWAGFGIFNNVIFGFSCLVTLAALLSLVKTKISKVNLSRLNPFARSQLHCLSNVHSPKISLNSKYGSLIWVLENLTKIIAVASLLPIVLINIPSLMPQTSSLINNDLQVMLLFDVIFFAAGFLITQKYNQSAEKERRQPLVTEKQDNKRLSNLQFGIFGGIAGAVVSGLLMHQITAIVQNMCFPGLILCGALGGLGFGTLSNGNKKVRGAIGCVFGFAAIIFGLVMTYNNKIIVGYLTGTNPPTPLYMWHGYSFLSFAENQLFTIQGLYFCFFGLLSAYLCAYYLSLKEKAE
jgi:hypothetical protein